MTEKEKVIKNENTPQGKGKGCLVFFVLIVIIAAIAWACSGDPSYTAEEKEKYDEIVSGQVEWFEKDGQTLLGYIEDYGNGEMDVLTCYQHMETMQSQNLNQQEMLTNLLEQEGFKETEYSEAAESISAQYWAVAEAFKDYLDSGQTSELNKVTENIKAANSAISDFKKAREEFLK